MQTFEVTYSLLPNDPPKFGGGFMRVDAANPADAVEAVKRAHPNVLIVEVKALPPRISNSAQDECQMNESANHSYACDGIPYSHSASSASRSVAS